MRNFPDKGDLVLVSLDPQSGHEQKGRRPALVISNHLFNQATGLAMVCPITNTFRNSPFHVELPQASTLTGYIMVEQVKSIDFGSRKLKFVEKGGQTILDDVLGILEACIFQNI